jgi:pimeloyl-ACP methyl ester carboxylesterase
VGIPVPARPRVVLVSVVLLLAAAAATVVGTSGGTAARPGQRAPAVAQGRPATLAGFYAQRLTWTPCHAYFQCARLWVPFDYARPGGRDFSLPVIKLPAARPAERIGALVFNPGGPGASGVQYTLAARTAEFTQEIRDRFDIVGFDPRGVGDSVPAVRCDETGQAGGPFYATPATAAELAADESSTQNYVQACVRGAGALLPYLGTPSVARDMDVLRAALGQSRLTYLGLSAGTALGASYVQQFPRQVRAIVLDGAVDPRTSGLDVNIAQAQGFTVAFDEFLAWCASQRACPLPSSVPQATQQVLRLITGANNHPLATTGYNGQRADGDTVRTAIEASLYAKSWWPDLEAALGWALRGDGTDVATLANSLSQDNTNGSHGNFSDANIAIGCLDSPWPKSVAAYQAAAARAARAWPLFGSAFVWSGLTCAYWPVPGHQVLTGTTSGAASGVPPVLVVGEVRDPATPYAGAVAMARWLPTGVLLGWNGAGHTSYLRGSSCVDNAVDAYLITLRTPPNGMVCG